MNEIVREWQMHFFSKPLLEIILCIAIIIAIRHRNKHSILKFVPIYITIFLLIFLLTEARTISSPKEKNYVWINALCEYIDYLSILAELFILSHIYCKLFNKSRFTSIVIIVNILFLVFFFFELFTDKLFYLDITHETKALVYTVEGMLLLPLCLHYFINLFRKPNISDLKEEPSFWISVGLLFFLTCTLPYSVLENFVPKSSFLLMYQFYSLFYIFYSVFFILIIKAFYCKPKSAAIEDVTTP